MGSSNQWGGPLRVLQWELISVRPRGVFERVPRVSRVGLSRVLKEFQDLLMDLQDTILFLQVLGQGSREDFRDLRVSLKYFQRHPVVFEGGSRGHQGLPGISLQYHSLCRGSDFPKRPDMSVWRSLTYKPVLANKPSVYRDRKVCITHSKPRQSKPPYYLRLNTTRSNIWMRLITYIVDISSHIQNKKLKAWM